MKNRDSNVPADVVDVPEAECPDQMQRAGNRPDILDLAGLVNVAEVIDADNAVNQGYGLGQ